MEKKLNLFSQKVAGCIGNVDPLAISEIIEISNQQKYIFHGIKINENFLNVNIEGVKPLTPEGGNVSYWTSGKSLFGQEPLNAFFTYGSSFFHYAHSGKGYMNLAISQYSDLEKIFELEKFKENSHLTLPEQIPRRLIQLLRVELDYNSLNLPQRHYGKMKERILLNLVYDSLNGGFDGGGLVVVKKKL